MLVNATGCGDEGTMPGGPDAGVADSGPPVQQGDVGVPTIDSSVPDAGPTLGSVFVRLLGAPGAVWTIPNADVSNADDGPECSSESGSRCAVSLPLGTTLRLEAGAGEGATLVGWSVEGCGASTTCDVTVTAEVTVEVTFAPLIHTLDLSVTGPGSLQSFPGGTLCAGECSSSHDHGDRVTLIATADEDALFAGFTDACAETTGFICEVTLDAATTVGAVFVPRTDALSVAPAGTGDGTITSEPAGIDCPGDCSESMAPGTTVTLTANAGVGSSFVGWSGACSGTANTCDITVDGAALALAVFERDEHPLTVTRAGDGEGRVHAATVGLDCGATCVVSVPHGEMLTLTASPDISSDFLGWGGACETAGLDTECTISPTEAATVSARFEQKYFEVSVETLGVGSGSVTGPGIDCPDDCVENLPYGTALSLSATPVPTSTFAGWGGACSGTLPCELTLTADVAVTATFDGHTPVLLNPNDADPDIRLRDDRLAADLDLDYGCVRSNVAIPPGAGVFYVEGHRLTNELGPYGVGVASEFHDVNGSGVGTSDQAFGVTGSGGIDYDNTFLGLFEATETEYYGLVVDYRGSSPIVHAIVVDYDWDAAAYLPHVAHSQLMSTVTTPVHVLVGGLREVVGPEIEVNTGNDTTNFPFHYDVDAILRADGLGDTADALVMGWGSTFAAAPSEAPTLTLSVDQNVANGAHVVVTATASDAEDGDLTTSVTWELLSSPYYDGRIRGTGGSFEFDAIGVGVHPAMARVVDSSGRTTTGIVRVVVDGPVATYSQPSLVIDATAGEGLDIDSGGTAVRFTGLGKMGVRANASCYGCFAYFEFSRLGAPQNQGGGLVTGTGNLNPYDWADVPASVAVNVLGGSWRNLIPTASFPVAGDQIDTYGIAVDYRGEHPIVYVVVADVLHYQVELDDVWTEIYPMLYGNPVDTQAGQYDEAINFGGSPFTYDVVTILEAEGIDTTGLVLGWGG